MPSENNNSEFLTWQFDFALTTFFEVDTYSVQSLLPPTLNPVEVVSGISLFNITSFNFPDGAFDILPAFQELIFSIIVTPDLSRGVPKFAMYVISLGSSCREHLEHSAEYYYLPIHEPLLKGVINKDNLSVDYSDSSGKILTMQNCSSRIHYNKNEKRYFQAITSKNDQLYIADVYIQASLFEHQQIGSAGKLYNHPFFKNLEFEVNGPVSYLQMIGEPGTIGQQFYYRPELL